MRKPDLLSPVSSCFVVSLRVCRILLYCVPLQFVQGLKAAALQGDHTDCELIAVLVVGIHVAISVPSEMAVYSSQNLSPLSDVVHVPGVVVQDIYAGEVFVRRDMLLSSSAVAGIPHTEELVRSHLQAVILQLADLVADDDRSYERNNDRDCHDYNKYDDETLIHILSFLARLSGGFANYRINGSIDF